MMVDIASMLSGPHLKLYLARCDKHPWFKEAQELVWEWNEKIKAMKARGDDPASLFEDPVNLHIDEHIGYAKAVFDNPDMLAFFEDHYERRQKDEKAAFSDEGMEIMRAFELWYFLHRGNPPQGTRLFAGRVLVGAMLDGRISDLDEPEARALALTIPYVKDRAA